MEMLVAMTLLALLMMALSGSIAFVGRSWDKGWRTSEGSAALSRVEGTVRHLIERSFPVSSRREKKDEFLFDGTPDSLRLVAYSAPGGLGGGLYVQEIVASGTGGQRQLIYRQYPFRGNGAVPEQVSEAPLLGGSLKVAFSYYGSPQPSIQPRWFNSWPTGRTLPDLIRLNIEANGDIWPPIVVRPFITAEYACLRSASAGLCRRGPVGQ
jgi:general secretion pathway protein J